MTDVIVVGAGVVGLSTAFHLAERGMDTLVLDRQVLAAGSTMRSGALIRAHYPTILEADLAWESLTEYFEKWGERVGGGCGFTRTGFVRLAAEEHKEALMANVAMLKEQVGVETELVGPTDLGEIDDSLVRDDISIAAYEPRGGYADPAATALGFLKAAEDLGARFECRRVEALLERKGKMFGVRTTDGDLEAPVVVLAAGAWSVPLAACVGVELPIRPARVQVSLFERPAELPTHLTFIDPANEVYARPTADRGTLVGRRITEAEWLDNPDSYAPDADKEFVTEAARRIGERIPMLKGAPYRSGWAGVVDVTPDGRPIMGPEGPEGLYLGVGWSGAGFKKASAVGSELARWISEGYPKRHGLSDYGLERFEKGHLIRGQYEYSASAGPH